MALTATIHYVPQLPSTLTACGLAAVSASYTTEAELVSCAVCRTVMDK